MQTVSRILRGQGKRHRPDTCRRVLDAAKELGYRPNLLGRALKSGRTYTIGVVRLGVGYRHLLAYQYHLACAAREAGYLMFTAVEDHWDRNDRLFTQMVEQLVGRQVDGLIIGRGAPLLPATRRYIASLPVPVLYTDWAPPRHAHRITHHHQDGRRQVFEHLKALGHQHVAYFPSMGAMDYPGHRIQPIQRSARSAGLALDTVPPDPQHSSSSLVEIWTHDSVRRYLANGGQATALIVHGNNASQGALVAIRQAGLRVPDDLGLIALEDDPFATLCEPSITSLKSDWSLFGRRTFETLHHLIRHPDTPPQQAFIPMELVVRASTAPLCHAQPGPST